MYHTLSINDLSKKQVSKLLNAHPVRVKMGSGAKIHVSPEQAKKMHRAGLKGCAITLSLDPYAIQHNQHLRDAVGMLRKSGLKGGTALIDQPFTVREAFQTVGQLKDALGFGFEGPLPYDKRKVALPFKRGMKGDGFFEDLGEVAKSAGKKVIKKIANEVVEYAGPAAGAAFAAAATAAGQPEFAPAAAILGNEVGRRAGRYANRKIQGMGHKRGGTALIDQPFTVRQAVDTTGRFIQDPKGTLGFGAKKGKGPKGLKKFQKWTQAIGDFLEPVAKPILGALTDKAVDMIGNYGGAAKPRLPRMLKADRPKRVMSEAQKAALAKGRAALRIKLNEMGAGVKKKKSGKALYPAGYKSGMALMSAGY